MNELSYAPLLGGQNNKVKATSPAEALLLVTATQVYTVDIVVTLWWDKSVEVSSGNLGDAFKALGWW